MELKVGLEEDPVELGMDFEPFFHAHFEKVARPDELPQTGSEIVDSLAFSSLS